MSVFRMVAAVVVMSAVAVEIGETSSPPSQPAQTIHMDEDRVAVSGYDLVSVTSGKQAIMGRPQYRIEHEGVNYHFISERNALIFKADPKPFLPEFGGFCAYGVRMGQRHRVDPSAFEVVDGRLYLFLDRATRKLWMEDVDGNINRAEQQWSAVQLAKY